MKIFRFALAVLIIAAGSLACAAPGPANVSPKPQPDTLATAVGPIVVHPIHHASLVLQWQGQTIYVDPVGPVARYRGLGRPTLILITHAHGDHLSPDTLASLDTRSAVVVMPASVEAQIGGRFGASQRVMANGDSLRVRGIGIHAMPMYNLPQTPDSRHPKGWGNGYVLSIGGKRIYISGDTEGTPEMRHLTHIDLAFVCMNLPYTMGVEQAADAVVAFAPRIVYPYHYRGQDIQRFKRLVKQRDPSIQVRLRDWYADDSVDAP